MEIRIECRNRSGSGGIIGLASYVDEHREAVERDLLTETGYELNDVGRALSWGALKSFLSTVKLGSALSGEIRPEMTEWSTVVKTNAILADIFDQLSLLNTKLSILITRKRGRKPEPYPRPWASKQRRTHRYGDGAIPIDELREWIKNRQRG